MLTDTIPAGLTYVSGTLTATSGVASITGNTITWSDTMIASARRYEMTTSADDAACAAPFATDGAYADLQAFSIFPDSGVSGDTVAYSVNFTTIPDIEYFGVDTGGKLVNFTDDGFAYFDPGTPGAIPWVNLAIPDPSEPNNLLAVDWRDGFITYDAGTNRGVSLASFGTGWLIEYDDLEDFNDSNSTLDMEVAMYSAVDDAPGAYEVIYAYDNISMTAPLLLVGTIGVENAGGTAGTQYAYDNVVITDGMGICFDWTLPATPPVTITFQATMDVSATGSTITNTVDHTVDNPSSLLASASAAVDVEALPYGVELAPSTQALTTTAGSVVTHTLTVTNTGTTNDTFTVTVTGYAFTTTAPATVGPLGPGASTTVDVVVTAGAAGSNDTATITVISQGDGTTSANATVTTYVAIYKLYLPIIQR